MKDKVIVITGGASGMGQTTAYKFASNGSKVVIADFNESNGIETVNTIRSKGGVAEFFKVDVSNYEEISNLVEFTVEQFGTLDIIWNNAGVSGASTILSQDIDTYHRTIAVNQHSVAYGIMVAGKKMKELGVKGVIINTASVFGVLSIQNYFSYGASKAAIENMTKTAALELAPYGIRVVAIAPGTVKTPIIKEALESGIGEQLKKYHMRGQLIEPIEIANVVYFLASEESSVINGTVVNLDDGWTSFKSN